LLGVQVKRASWRGTDVAVKIIYRKAFHDKDQRQLFQKEVDIISQLHHPNIVQFIGTCAMPGEHGQEGHLVLVTEFCGGGSLRQLIAENSAALVGKKTKKHVCSFSDI
jgi:serine/threonine protein kinase